MQTRRSVLIGDDHVLGSLTPLLSSVHLLFVVGLFFFETGTLLTVKPCSPS